MLNSKFLGSVGVRTLCVSIELAQSKLINFIIFKGSNSYDDDILGCSSLTGYTSRLKVLILGCTNEYSIL